MRPNATLPLATLLACGPLAPANDVTSTTTSGTSETTDTPPTTSSTASTTPTTLPDSTSEIITSSATSTGEQTFVITLDAGDPFGKDCDVFAQDCPAGQKCAAWADNGSNAWNATKCVDVMGTAAPGEPCSTIDGGVSGKDTCALGAMCWYVDETNLGTCVALCTGTPAAPTCGPQLHCYISSEGILNLCLPDCNPLLQDCPGTDLCLPINDFFDCIINASRDAGQVNDPCEFVNSCDKGLLCLNAAAASAACDVNASGCCQPFCEFPDAPCPNPDQQCLQWYDPMMPIPLGYENIGVCAIPK